MPAKTEDDKTELALEERDHRKGCPTGRTEAYTLPRPPSQGGGLVTVVRCIECGGETIQEDA